MFHMLMTVLVYISLWFTLLQMVDSAGPGLDNITGLHYSVVQKTFVFTIISANVDQI